MIIMPMLQQCKLSSAGVVPGLHLPTIQPSPILTLLDGKAARRSDVALRR